LKESEWLKINRPKVHLGLKYIR